MGVGTTCGVGEEASWISSTASSNPTRFRVLWRAAIQFEDLLESWMLESNVPIEV